MEIWVTTSSAAVILMRPSTPTLQAVTVVRWQATKRKPAKAPLSMY